MEKDIRWLQRLANFDRAIAKLKEAVDPLQMPDEDKAHFSDLEKEGLIKRFEYSYELAWNVMKDYLEFQGNTDIKGPRDAIRAAFKVNLIEDGEIWMDMIRSRQLTAHTYNQAVAEDIFTKIIAVYYHEFLHFQTRMKNISEAI